MGDHTSIEWVRALAAARNAIPATWNPIDGCSRQSEGCRNCWAAGLVHTRLSKSLPNRYAGLTEMDGNGVPRFNGRVKLVAHALDRPLKAREPRVYFTGDMTDLFHTSVPSEWLDRIFVAIAAGQRHTHLLLTKRPAVMRAYLADPDTPRRIDDLLDQRGARGIDAFGGWPLPNVWIGATVTDQADANANVPELLAAPAVKRFLSLEPLLGPVDLTRVVIGEGSAEFYEHPNVTKARFTINALAGVQSFGWRGLDWCFAGGEAGRDARPTHPDWFRDLRDACGDAGVPFLFKQWGEWAPGECAERSPTRTERTANFFNSEWRYWSVTPRESREGHVDDEPDLYRLGKKAAGRLLDGRLWDEVPDLTVGA